MNQLPKQSPQLLFRALFDNVQCQSHTVTDRHNIYLIFITLLQNRIEDLKAMGPDFVYGLISAIDGEGNPKNLMLLFNIFPDFIREFPLGHLTEEMFEIISCYFPVDFSSVSVSTVQDFNCLLDVNVNCSLTPHLSVCIGRKGNNAQ